MVSAVSRGGDGQVEAGATRVVLMAYMLPRVQQPASLTRDSADVARACNVWADGTVNGSVCCLFAFGLLAF